MEIVKHKQFQKLQRLSFCYLCGKTFSPQDTRTRDHVPPKSIFLGTDRHCPLILPTHNNCNQDESWADEIVGQLINVMHGKYPQEHNRRMDVQIHEHPKTKQPMLVLQGINFRGFIARCVKAFHAALYAEYLPQETPSWFDPPMPVGEKKNGQFQFEKIRVQFPLFVEVIKKNRVAGKVDRLICYNNQCFYECVWEQMDDGTWACIFAFNIYNWKDLGDALHHPKRGCMGFYMPINGKPKNATTGIIRILEIPIKNSDPLDPFGD